MLDTAVLSEAQREHYQRSGWVAVPGLVDSEWLERLRRVTDEFVEQSRALTESNIVFDLDVGHSADEPRLRRLSSPTDLHETYWEFASQSVIIDVARRSARSRREVPPLEAQLQGAARRRRGEVAPGHPVLAAHQLRPAHHRRVPRGRRAGHGRGRLRPREPRRAALRPLRRGRRWVGALVDADVARAGVERPQYPIGPAGTITVHNCRTVHGSAPNRSDRARPLLLQTYAAADAFAYTELVKQSPHGEELIRGEPAALGPATTPARA